MKVFLDTNVLAAAIATRGLCAELLEAILQFHELVTCQQVLEELERFLKAKLRLAPGTVAGYVDLLKEEAVLAQPGERLVLTIKDADDAAILSCAVAAAADVFVTGDKELLDLRKAGGLEILSPRQFWNRMAGLPEK